MLITIVAGARPNFMKIAPIIHAVERQKTPSFAKASDFVRRSGLRPAKSEGREGERLKYRLVHTGQHYDPKLSETFFEELGIPKPDVNLEVGSGTQAEQTAGIMLGFEKELMAHPSDLVIVVGDVTSTMACSITAKKLNTKVAHIEAGIRSFDLTMPEEINRMVTDSITDLFFTTSPFANENLRKAGVPEDRIFYVGNVMIDTLLANRHRFIKPAVWGEKGLKEKEYIVITLHRPVNVDDPENLHQLLEAITDASGEVPVIFPVHPRTLKVLNSHAPSQSRPLAPSLHLTEPMGYLEFNYLVEKAFAVITDSGGITEETTVMGVPCMTLRDSTERPETCTVGTNELLGTDPAAIKPAMKKLFAGQWKKGGIPELWDGHAAERIVEVLLRYEIR